MPTVSNIVICERQSLDWNLRKLDEMKFRVELDHKLHLVQRLVDGATTIILSLYSQSIDWYIYRLEYQSSIQPHKVTEYMPTAHTTENQVHVHL